MILCTWNISYKDKINRLKKSAFYKIRATENLSEEIVDQIIDSFLCIVIEKYHLRRNIA